MCGIAGFSGPWNESLLRAMADSIAHRGPDDDGVWMQPGDGCRAGLAHRRLSIIDLSAAGHQPMTTDCGGCRSGSGIGLWLAYNGEIYNFQELREELQAAGHRFFSGTDSEVILHGYAEHGPAFFGRLNGIFAFGLVDGRLDGRPDGVEQHDVFVVRDGLGVKPLYWAETSGGVAFASELKALLQVPGLSRDLDVVAVHHHMSFGWAPAPRTMLQAVRKLHPGEYLLLRAGRVERRVTYYEVPVHAGGWHAGSFEELAARTQQEVAEAIDRQLVADVPVGTFLSGGLDSSLIVALAKRAQPSQPLPAYCIEFEVGEGVGGHVADAPFAERVARQFGVDLTMMRVSHDIIRRLPELLWHLDEPEVDPAPLNSLAIAERAREDGVPVLLSGQGGDDLFSGYRRHRALGLERLWGWLPRRARRLVAGPARRAVNGELPLPGMAGMRLRQASKALSVVDLQGDERIASYFLWGGERLRRGLYSRRAGAELMGRSTLEPLLESLGRLPAGTPPLERMLYLEKRHFLADHNLNYSDKTTMAFGVEGRVPYLDHRLVDFASRLAPDVKMRGGEPKAILKKAAEGVLPHDLIYRSKTGFGAPLRTWIRNQLAPTVERVLSPESLAARGLFDPAAVQRLIALDRRDRVDGAYLIYGLLSIELWCRLFVDGEEIEL